MTTDQHHTTSSDATRTLGESLGRILRPGDLVTLQGPLGAGKTTLAQGMARGLGTIEPVTSPTFVLILEYEGALPLLHLDAYRLENMCYDALRDAGVPDFLDREDAVKLVEWPERIEDFLPTPRLAITIKGGPGEDDRTIEVVDSGEIVASGTAPS